MQLCASKLQQESFSLFFFSTLEAHFPINSSRRSTCLSLPRPELGQHLRFQRCEPLSGALLACGNSLGPQKPAVSTGASGSSGQTDHQDLGAGPDPTYSNLGRGGSGIQAKVGRKPRWRFSLADSFSFLPLPSQQPCQEIPLGTRHGSSIAHFPSTDEKQSLIVSLKQSPFGPKSKLFAQVLQSLLLPFVSFLGAWHITTSKEPS